MQGAQAILLACTEIPLLIKQEHTAVPLLDVTAIHAERAVELAVQ
jgi:aspartate racemase